MKRRRSDQRKLYGDSEAKLLVKGRKRIFNLARFVLLPASLLLGARMVFLQRGAAATTFEKRTVLPAIRGQLLAADGSPMAVTLDEYTVTANPRGVQDKAKMAQLIASAIGGDVAEYETLLQKTTQPNGRPNYYVRLRKHVDKDYVDQLKELMGAPKDQKETKEEKKERRDFWAPIAFELTPKRQYPMNNFASQLIGMTDPSGNGITGLERGYNKLLSGTDGEVISQVDARNRPLPDFVEKWTDPVEGQSLLTTINPAIQSAAEDALANLAEKFEPDFATAVVLRPKTGEIVALANNPSFDLNNRPSNVIELATNRAVNFSYEPGSTFKVITASAAIETVPDWQSKQYYCGGAQRVGRHLMHCWISSTPKGAHGWETLSDGIRDSCNFAMYGFARAMGADNMLEYAKKFGIGHPIDLPHVETQGGLLPANKPSKWSQEQLANFSFGQGMMMSPYQVARMAAIIANDGVMMKPLLIKKVLDNAGNTVESFKPEEEQRVVSASTAKIVTSMMERVVTEGSGKPAAVPGYRVAGKTGSAQVAEGKLGYSSHKFISSFVGFLPADNPEFVILTMAYNPKGSHWGGTVAAPVFAEIAKKAMLDLRLQEGANAPAPDPTLMPADMSQES